MDGTAFNPLIPVNLPESSKNFVYELVTFYETTYWLENEFPSEEEVLKKFLIKKPGLQAVLPKINEILEKRSLPPVEISQDPVSQRPKKAEVDPVFAVAVNLVCDVNDKRSKAAKFKSLEAMGFSTKKWEVLLNDPINRAYYEARVKKVVKNTETTADLALAKNVETGDLQSIKYFNEVTGKYRPEAQTQFMLSLLVVKLMEILAKHVPTEVIEAISVEFDQVLAPELKAG